jgi:hypothetical protein
VGVSLASWSSGFRQSHTSLICVEDKEQRTEALERDYLKKQEELAVEEALYLTGRTALKEKLEEQEFMMLPGAARSGGGGSGSGSSTVGEKRGRPSVRTWYSLNVGTISRDN